MTLKTVILLTCYNRKDKTLSCLTSLFNCSIPSEFKFDIIIVDDGSTDGTSEAVKTKFPLVSIINGNGNLFWAGGMRTAWSEVIGKGYDAYILINDDVVLNENVLEILSATHQYALTHFGKGGIYVSSTIDQNSNQISYGGSNVSKSLFGNEYKMVKPTDTPINCQITNANILFVSANVVDQIGIFDNRFKQSFADYDYSLTAFENNLPVLVCPGVGGLCKNDHVNNWSSANTTLRKRIAHLYSPKGLEYNEYMYFVKKHFLFSLPYFFIMVWIKTFFPVIWEKYKK